MGVQWSEVKRARRDHAMERQEQRQASSTDVVDSDEYQYITKKIVGHSLELQGTVSMPLGLLYAMPTPPHYLSLGMPRNVIEQLDIGRSQTTAIDKEKTMHSSLENISHPTSAWVFVELLTFQEQFKLKCGRCLGRSTSVSTMPIMEMWQAGTPTKETKEKMLKVTFHQESRSAFMKYTKGLWKQLVQVSNHIVGTNLWYICDQY